MLFTQYLGKVSDEEAYRTWNMGQGMIIITPEPERVIDISNQYNIESKQIGYVTQEPKIRIRNEGTFKEGKEELVFDLK